MNIRFNKNVNAGFFFIYFVDFNFIKYKTKSVAVIDLTEKPCKLTIRLNMTNMPLDGYTEDMTRSLNVHGP